MVPTECTGQAPVPPTAYYRTLDHAASTWPLSSPIRRNAIGASLAPRRPMRSSGGCASIDRFWMHVVHEPLERRLSISTAIIHRSYWRRLPSLRPSTTRCSSALPCMPHRRGRLRLCQPHSPRTPPASPIPCIMAPTGPGWTGLGRRVPRPALQASPLATLWYERVLRETACGTLARRASRRTGPDDRRVRGGPVRP
jgi:hypothetical protein